MSKKTLTVAGHVISIEHGTFSGKTSVLYDGRIVASGGGVFESLHASFIVEENGKQVSYDIAESAGAFDSHFVLRRDGIVVFQS